MARHDIPLYKVPSLRARREDALLIANIPVDLANIPSAQFSTRIGSLRINRRNCFPMRPRGTAKEQVRADASSTESDSQRFDQSFSWIDGKVTGRAKCRHDNSLLIAALTENENLVVYRLSV